MVIVSSPTGATGLAASNATTSIQEELVGGNQSGGAPTSYNDSMAAEAWEQFNKIQSDLRKLILLQIERRPKQCGKIWESNDQSQKYQMNEQANKSFVDYFYRQLLIGRARPNPFTIDDVKRALAFLICLWVQILKFFLQEPSGPTVYLTASVDYLAIENIECKKFYSFTCLPMQD